MNVNTYQSLLEKYRRQAGRYDRRWNLHWGEATMQAAIQAVPWHTMKRGLDVGCGTGLLEQAVMPVLNSGQRLVGVDISMSMLREAKEKIPSDPRIGWMNASAELLPFPAGSVDTIICNNSFHYYRRPGAVLGEFRRVLGTGGHLVLSDWCSDFITPRVARLALHLAHQTNLHRYSLQHCYTSAELASLLKDAGFQVEDFRGVEMDLGWGVMIYSARA